MLAGGAGNVMLAPVSGANPASTFWVPDAIAVAGNAAASASPKRPHVTKAMLSHLSSSSPGSPVRVHITASAATNRQFVASNKGAARRPPLFTFELEEARQSVGTYDVHGCSKVGDCTGSGGA